MKELLTAASRVGGATHLVAAVTSVLQYGPRSAIRLEIGLIIKSTVNGGSCNQRLHLTLNIWFWQACGLKIKVQ